MRISYAFAAVMLLCATPSYADTVRLKTGDGFEGKIVERTNEYIRIETAGGEKLFIAHEIDSINGEAYYSPVVWGDGSRPAVAPMSASRPAADAEDEALQDRPAPLAAAPAVVSAASASGLPQDPSDIETPEEDMPSPGSFMTVGLPQEKKEDARADMMKKAPEWLKPMLANPLAFLKWILLIVAVMYVVTCACVMKISMKTGLGKPALAWIPIANFFLLCDLAGLGYAWVLVFFASVIPVVGGIIGILGYAFIWGRIAGNLRRPAWLGWLMVLPGVGLIIMLLLGFTDAAGDDGRDTVQPQGGAMPPGEQQTHEPGSDTGFKPYQG